MCSLLCTPSSSAKPRNEKVKKQVGARVELASSAHSAPSVTIGVDRTNLTPGKYTGPRGPRAHSQPQRNAEQEKNVRRSSFFPARRAWLGRATTAPRRAEDPPAGRDSNQHHAAVGGLLVPAGAVSPPRAGVPCSNLDNSYRCARLRCSVAVCLWLL